MNKTARLWKATTLVIAVALFMLIAACGGNDTNKNNNNSSKENTQTQNKTENAVNNQSEAENETPREVLEYAFIAEYQNLPNDNPPLKEQLVMDKFDIKTSTNYITTAEGLERLSVLFASGNYPDVIPNLNHEPEVKKWGEAGYLLPMSDYLDQLPNYMNWWSDEEWQTVKMYASNPDGSMYYLPAKNYRSHSKAWIYRQDVFEELGLTFPETLDELYETLIQLKQAYPDSVGISNRGMDGVLGIAVLANRLPGNMFSGFSGFFRDPDQNNEVRYAQATDKFRESLIFLNKLYRENLIEKEFPTMTTEQWTQRGVNDRAFIMYDFGTRAAYFQNLVPENASAVWTWADANMSTGDKPGFVDRELPFFAYGPVITNKVEGERLERMLEYFNWAASEEGVRFHTLGVEGETYEIVDGNPQYMEGITDKHDMFGKHGFIEFLVTDPEYVATNPDRQTDLAISAAFAEKPHVPFTAYTLSQEEQDLANSLITGMIDLAREFTVRAIMGQVDVNDDSVWERYLRDLDQSGLAQLLPIYSNAVQ